MTWDNGSKYSGDYFEGKKHGYGIATSQKGKQYDGPFKNGV